MSISAKKCSTDSIVPLILPARRIRILPHKRVKNTPKFAMLADIETCLELKDNCIEIDISEELLALKKGSSLEITVPVLGLCDLKSSHLQENRYFPSPLIINGFGSKPSQENNYPRPEFVLITDIIGNQFEVIVSDDDCIEIPEDGTGLFSLVSSITFIYDENQIINEARLEGFQEHGFSNKLLLLAPEDSIEPFEVIICVTHINPYHQRLVDTLRTIIVEYSENQGNYQIKTAIDKNKLNNTLNINITLKEERKTNSGAFKACISLRDERKFTLCHSSCEENHGWLQDPIQDNVYTKHINLSHRALNLLVRKIYSENDFIKDYLNGDTFNLSKQQGYNDFLLSPEALSCFYDILVNELVHHRISQDFIFNRVPQEKLFFLDLSQIQADFHDSVVLSRIQAQLENQQLEALKELFYSGNFFLNEHFSVFTTEYMQTIPEILFEILPPDHDEIPHYTGDNLFEKVPPLYGTRS